jgi:cysteine-rich repeat protein
VYESCDDGNTQSSDGCSSTCNVESGWLCEQPGSPCRFPTCGDGFVDWIADPTGSGSGGSTSVGSDGNGGTVSATGGMGNVGHRESCDDANTLNGDGCSASCEVEPGYSCWTGTCKLAVCGDGIADYPSEECDDGNQTANDGCSNCRYDGGGGSSGGASSIGTGGATQVRR